MNRTTKIILAAAGGFIAGVLLAPKSGVETRKDIERQMKKARKVAAVKADQATAAARQSAKTVSESAKEVEAEVAAFGASAKATAEKIAAEAAELGGEARTRSARVVHTAQTTAHAVTQDAKRHLNPPQTKR
jgi:gas vesicle protein